MSHVVHTHNTFIAISGPRLAPLLRPLLLRHPGHPLCRHPLAAAHAVAPARGWTICTTLFPPPRGGAAPDPQPPFPTGHPLDPGVVYTSVAPLSSCDSPVGLGTPSAASSSTGWANCPSCSCVCIHNIACLLISVHVHLLTRHSGI